MKIFLLFCSVFSFVCASTQSFTYPTSGTASGVALRANDNVTLVPSITSFGCTPTNGTSLVYSSSHVSSGAIHRGTSWKDSCLGSYEILKFDFSTVPVRPRGLSFTIFDIDNGSDSVSIVFYSLGQQVHYTYQLFANTFISAHGASPHFGFVGSNQNNAGQNDDRGSVQLSSTNATNSIDSVIVYKYNGRNIGGSPSQSFAAFQWASIVTLPLRFTHFEITDLSSEVQFSWTAEESSVSDTYHVQASADGKKFQTIETRTQLVDRSEGTQKHVTRIAKSTCAPFTYFRIVGRSPSGKETYSLIRKQATTVNVPFSFLGINNQLVHISVQALPGTLVTTSLFDGYGRKIKQVTTRLQYNQQQVTIPVQQLVKPAVYLLQATLSTGETTTYQFINQ